MGWALSQADFVDLIHEHAAALYRIAYRMVGDCHDAEDVVQETLRSAWKSRGNFQCGRGRRAWLAANFAAASHRPLAPQWEADVPGR